MMDEREAIFRTCEKLGENEVRGALEQTGRHFVTDLQRAYAWQWLAQHRSAVDLQVMKIVRRTAKSSEVAARASVAAVIIALLALLANVIGHF